MDIYSVNKEHCVTSIMELALQCTYESPEERINTLDILARLQKIKVEFLREPSSTSLPLPFSGCVSYIF